MLPASADGQKPMQMASATATPPVKTGPADVTLHIGPVLVDVTKDKTISTIGYNGQVPGSLIRLREGKQVSVQLFNDTDTPEFVHWHGQFIPSEVDGAGEEKSIVVPPRGQVSYQFTPRPAGIRWVHTHVMPGNNLSSGLYTGEFGLVYIEPNHDPGSYDQEVFLATHEFEPFYSTSEMEEEEGKPEDPALAKEVSADKTQKSNGWEIGYQTFTVNGQCLGYGDPIRVKEGQRVMFRILNASATETIELALPGHEFYVVALDGNPVPHPNKVKVLQLGSAERVEAIVEMKHPGIWILGSTEKMVREAGLGVVVEYAGQHRQPQWIDPPRAPWDYTIFGKPASNAPPPEKTIDLAFEKIPGGAGKFNSWLVNGKSYPHENEFVLQKGTRYRLMMRNRSDDAHPMHLHRHLWELVEINGKKTAGIMKDTVVVPYYGRAIVDFTADQPGLSLFHCHIQQHMDYGFKALFRYA